jgi:hypothetical protein
MNRGLNYSGAMPDLIIGKCLFGCDNANCAAIWINVDTGHRIICACKCNNHHASRNERLEKSVRLTMRLGSVQSGEQSEAQEVASP